MSLLLIAGLWDDCDVCSCVYLEFNFLLVECDLGSPSTFHSSSCVCDCTQEFFITVHGHLSDAPFAPAHAFEVPFLVAFVAFRIFGRAVLFTMLR